MANRPLETETGFPTPPSSTTDHPPSSRWWTQSYSLLTRREKCTEEEKSAIFKPALCAFFTFVAFSAIFIFLLSLNCPHVNFSVESISVSLSSSATWHVDFLVKNPSTSRCLIYYNGDDVHAKLGSLNAAVLKTSTTRGSSDCHTSFSVDLATEGNQSDVVAASLRVFELDLKLGAKKKVFMYEDEYGYFDIRCQNLSIGYEKFKCHSSFEPLEQSCYKSIINGSLLV